MGEYSKDQAWKKDLKEGDEIDAFDKAKVWYASTILEIKDHTDPDGRKWTMCKVGFRLYHPDATKTDEEGKKYEGWSSRFDEWLPLWSPKIAKLYTHAKPKGGKGTRLYEDTVIDDSSDPQIKEGEDMIYAVIRPRKCKSYLLVDCLNLFGKLGGYDKMLERMNDKENPIEFELLAHYMESIGKVYPMYHREFVSKFCVDVKNAVQNSILNAPEASIRNVRKERIESIVSRLNDILKRAYTYDEREQEIEHLNLDIVLMCLKSNFLERRIQGIKSLAETLKNLKYSKANRISSEYMLEWLEKHKILELIFDQKNYHVQIIQRSKEILKFLIVEDKLSEEQLNLFWRATEFDDETRREMYKIIDESSTPMQTHHVMQFLNKFKAEKDAKIIPEAVNCIYEMGKFSKGTTEHSQSIADLLWRFATDQQNPLEVSNIAITKLADLLKKWKYSTAKPYFYKCLDNLRNHQASIESIKILRRIFRDVEYILTSFDRKKAEDKDFERGDKASDDNEDQEENIRKNEDENIICTSACILHFIEKENIIEVFLQDFREYSKAAQARLDQVKEKGKVQEFIFDGRFDHKTNITERLEFLKFLASHSSYTISRKEVDVIWSSLVDESKIDYDEEAMFKWLKESCETDVGSAQVWQLKDIGEIFNERFSKGSGEMGNLTLDGFYCIQSYFLLANETSEKLRRVKTKPTTSSGGMTSFSNSTGAGYSAFSFNRMKKKPEEQPEEAGFIVHVEPRELDGVSNIWKIIIESQNEEVQQKAIKFLVQLYHNLAPSIEKIKKEINYECLETALNYLRSIQDNSEKPEETKSKQIISIIKVFDEFLAQSERKGTTGLKQQRSLLKGELLSKIQITNSVSYNKLIGRRIELALYSNATVYDIKRIIGAVNKVPAEYVRLIRYSTTSEIKDIDNGKTLAELNFKPNESLIANKQNMGNVPKAPLLNPDKSLTKEAEMIFGEWFDQFSHDGLMAPEDCVEFIRSCTDDKCKTTDGRVKNLFQNHDHDGDGKVDKAGFVEFYRQASLKKEDVVRANILAHNYRNDLKKISDMCEENTDKTVLPRYILSHEQEYFDTLFSLLDRPDDSSKEAWNLIQKLVTNPTIQSKILNLKVEKNASGDYDWDSLIDTKSIFKLLYMFQIIESLIEEGGENEVEICKVYKNKDTTKETKPPGNMAKKQEEEEKDKEKEKEAEAEDEGPAEYLVSDLLASNQKDKEELMRQESETKELRKSWIFRFLEKKGFEFSYDLFSKNQTDIRNMNSFQKNFLGFLLKILRIFITSAFLAVEPEVAAIVDLVKKQSNVKPVEESTEGNEDTWGSMRNTENEENIYSTPTGKKSSVRQVFVDDVGQILEFSDEGHAIGVSTEDFLFNDEYADIDSDKATGSVEDAHMSKKSSTVVHHKPQVDTVDKKIEQLASQLKGDLGHKMLKVIDFNHLQIIVLQNIASLVDKYEMDFDERKIVENSLSLWLGCVLHNPKILENFFTFKCNEFEDVKDLILRGILYPSLFRVREEFLHTLYMFATKIEKSKVNTFEYTLKAMLQKLPKDNEGEEACTAQYFELVSKLIEEYFSRVKEGKASKEIFEVTKFFTDVIERIKSHQSREVRNSSRQDETLIGYLKIAHMVLDRGGLGECVQIAIERDFITELFQRCLFPNNLSVSNEDVTEGTDLAESLLVGNKCKTEESRKWAYKLLWTLCNNSLTLLNELIVRQMFPLCKQIKLHPGWLYTPSGDTRKGKYSGIRNLGCICYMNSMLQQLYHVPAFRYQLLQADDGAAPDWQEYKNRTIDDNVLHQLQRLFGHLELSERVDYNPIEFCFSFKEMDGSPTNTSVQHDTEEFFNIIFDRIENLIKPTPQKYLLQSVFGGKHCSQMVCKECGFIRNRFEDFYNLKLIVKERKSMEESLKKNLEGEVISDYECPGCKKKVDITKRTLLSETPNVLVVQLQRIVFDFDRFENQKVNTLFEFPDTLDLTPYSLNHIMKSEGKLTKKDLGQEEESPTKKPGEESDQEGEDEFEGLNDEEKKERIEERQTFQESVRNNENECYQYKLVGVIIHVGTADAGHYYSLINTDRFQKDNEQDEDWLDTSKDKWMEFNDSRVSDYNFEDLKADAYGGSSGNDDFFGGIFKSSSYGKSAYLLVYEKRYKKPIKILVPEETEKEAKEASTEGLECDDSAKSRLPKYHVPEGVQVKEDLKKNEKYYDVPMNKIGMFVPNKIYKEIWEDNLEFSFEKLIYSKEFYEFVKELMMGTLNFKQKADTLSEEDRGRIDEVISNMTKVGNKLALEVLVKAYHNYKLKDVAEVLVQLYEASDEAVINTMKSFLEGENSDQLLYVFQILLTCNDKISRINTAKIVSTVVNRCFEIEKDILEEEETVKIQIEELISDSSNIQDPECPRPDQYAQVTRPKSMAVRFWKLAIRALKEKGPSNWSKFDQLLTMIRDIAIGGETQLNLIMKRGGLIEFIDFMLGPNSPNCKAGERRTKMGSVYATPNFGPLLEAVSHMVVRCYTPTFTQDSEHRPNTIDQNAATFYNLTEADIENFFLHEDFLRIAILNSSEILGKALAHISYKNIEVSKAIGKVILKTINTSDYEKIKHCMLVTKPYLYIEDEYQRNRAEWILGFSCLYAQRGTENVSLPRFGTASISHINDEAYSYLSPIDLMRNNDALLALLWRYRGKMDLYVINCLNIFLEIIVESPFLSEYVSTLDPPTYEFARFTDWFRPYLSKELEKAQRNTSYRQAGKKEECIQKCFDFLEKYEANLKAYEDKLRVAHEGEVVEAAAQEHKEQETQEQPKAETESQDIYHDDAPVISAYPPRYIIGCTTKMEEISKEERGGFVVTVHKIFVEYADSQPTLNSNKTLPGYAFYNSKIDAEEYDRKNYHHARRGRDDSEDGENWHSHQEHVSNLDDESHYTEARKQGVSKVEVTNKNEDVEHLDNDQEAGAAPKIEEKSISDWNLPKKEGDLVILVTVENKNTKSYVFKMKFVCDDETSRENIKTPINEISSSVKPLFNDMWMCVSKLFPEKEWGNFHIEWDFEEKQPEAFNRNKIMLPTDRESDEYMHYIYGPTIQMNYYNM